MEDYKKKLNRRIKILGVFTFLGAAVSILFRQLTISNVNYLNGPNYEIIRSFSTGVLFGWVFFMVALCIRYNSAMKDENKLRELKIKDDDERLKYIREKAGGFGFNLVLSLLLLSAIAAGYYNFTVAVTLYAVVIGMSLIKGILKLYYFKFG